MSLSIWMAFVCGVGLTACCWSVYAWRQRIARQQIETLLEDLCNDPPNETEIALAAQRAIDRASRRATAHALELRRREQLFQPRHIDEERN